MCAFAPSAWDPDACARSALFWPLLPAAREFASFEGWPEVEDLDRLLGARAGVRFFAQRPAPRGERRRAAARRNGRPPYDAAICEQGFVPTRRRSWHDYWNALVWASMPRAKRMLHARQHAARLARAGEASGARTRTREQDGLALLDEGGVVLLSEPRALGTARAALAARDDARIAELTRQGLLLGVIFGHAVYEHLAREAPAVRATVHLVAAPGRPRVGPEAVLLADAALEGALAEPGSFSDPSTFRSLPVTPVQLGVAAVRGQAGGSAGSTG